MIVIDVGFLIVIIKSIRVDNYENHLHYLILGCFYAFLPDMFEGLRKKWKVGPAQLVLILFTFAIGGSLTGFAGKKLMNLFSIEENWLWIVVYVLVVTLIWPVAVLLVSIPFGQFPFFSRYIKKIGAKIGLGRSNHS